MQRAADRLAVFGLALILQGALSMLIGPPPDGRPTWFAWLLAQLRRSTLLEGVPPRLRVFAPFAASVALIRAAAAIERRRPAGPGRKIAILLQALLLAATFDAWRGVRLSDALKRDLDESEVADDGQPLRQSRLQSLHEAETERVEAEIGRVAIAAGEGVVGPWAAYAVFDLSGAVAYAAAESLGGPIAGPGSEGPLAAMLDPARRLAPVRRGRDAIAAAATLAAHGRSDLQATELEELALGSESPLPVTAMSVALDRRASWNGRSVGWHRPAPDLVDLNRARRLHLKALGLLAAAAAGVAAAGGIFEPARDDRHEHDPESL